jgi:hypothetical protein
MCKEVIKTMGLPESVVNGTFQLNTISDNRSYTHQEQLRDLYEKFLLLYEKGFKYISLDNSHDELSFSDCDIEVIRSRKDLFYLCTPKRALLVVWILNELRSFFVSKGMPRTIAFFEIYDYLREKLSIYSVNKSNLLELLKCDEELTYEHLLEAEQRLNNSISSMGDLHIPTEQFNRNSYERTGNTENVKYHTRCLLGIDQADGSIEKPLSEAEHEVLKNITVAIEETDLELCRQCFQIPERVIPIINALNVFSRQFLKQKERMETLCDTLKCICAANETGRVCSLIRAYTTNVQVQNILTINFGNCIYVSDLETAFNRCVQDDSAYMNVLSFLRWLQTDLRQSVTEGISTICKNERQIEVIKGRARGATLEELGQHFGITRERIRQIEVKAERSFLSFYSRFRPQYIFLSFTESDICFDSSDLNRFIGDYAAVFAYFTKKSEVKNVTWSNELNAFIVGDCSWYDDVLREVHSLPEHISINQMMDVVNNFKKRLGILIEDDIIKNIITSHYSQKGDIYSRSRITKKDMYKIIFEKYYPNGMKLFDNYEMMRFKARLQDVFATIDFGTEDTRSISTRITDFTILCDRGKYILPTAIQIQPDLLEEIHSYILNNERSTIMFTEIFERYKSQLLEKSNIHNRYFLHGMLKHYWRKEFEFSRDIICHGSAEDRSIRKHIEDFIFAKQGSITIKEIKDEFLGITDIVLSMALADNSDILQWGVGEYIHASLINIEEKEATKLKQALDAELKEGSVSTRALYEHLFAIDAGLLNENEIYNHIALLSVYQYLFPDDYAFSRPFISVCGIEGTTMDTIIEQYIASFDELAIAGLKGYLEDKHVRIMNFSALIDNNCSDFLRVDEDLLIRAKNLSVTDDIINDIEESVLSALGEKGYIAAKYFERFFFFPYIGVKWTPYFLVSFIKKYCTKLAISQYVVDYRYLNETIVKKSLQFKNHDELILYALRFEENKAPFTNLEDVEVFLRSEGLVATAIPQSLFESGSIVINEFGKITIT